MLGDNRNKREGSMRYEITNFTNLSKSLTKLYKRHRLSFEQRP